MFKISKMADYAVVILVALAVNKTSLLSAARIVDLTDLPEPTVSKILKILKRAEIIRSVRGVNGGYFLAHSEDEISLKSIVFAVDGTVSIVACAEQSGSCCYLEKKCSVRGRWDNVNIAISRVLELTSLADMCSQTSIKCVVSKEELNGGY